MGETITVISNCLLSEGGQERRIEQAEPAENGTTVTRFGFNHNEKRKGDHSGKNVEKEKDETHQDASGTLVNPVQGTRFKAIFEQIEDSVLIVNPADGAFIEFNSSAYESLGYKRADFLKFRLRDIEIPGKNAIPDLLQKIVHEGSIRYEAGHRTAEGKIRHTLVSASPFRFSGNTFVLCIWHDISEIKKHEEQRSLFASIFENCVEGIMITDANGIIIKVNPAFEQMSGFTADELIGSAPRILKSDRHVDPFFDQLWEDLKRSGKWTGDIWNRKKNGEAYPQRLAISALKNDHGETTHYVAIFHDISDFKQNEQNLKYQAYHDALTGLPNRQLFYDRLELELARSKRDDSITAVMFIDLDKFKEVNDSLGHPIGDELLKQVAERLKNSCRKMDTVARLGGDEFLLILPNITNKGREVIEVARRILISLSTPFFIEGHEIVIGASIGIALFPFNGNSAEELVKRADLAMYRAKGKGGCGYEMYSRSIQKKVERRKTLEKSIRAALEEENFVLFYQPVLDLKRLSVSEVEVLLRLPKNGNRILLPNIFIPVAEESGIMCGLGEWVIKNACTQLKNWHGEGFGHLTISVNITSRQFYDPRLVRQILMAVERSGISPGAINLELTENILVRDVKNAGKIVNALSEAGIGIAFDDFGDGCASFGYLSQFPVKTVKLHHSLLKYHSQNSGHCSLVRETLCFAHGHNLSVVAKGVENSDQFRQVRTNGFDGMQGYFFCKPLSADHLPAVLTSLPEKIALPEFQNA